MNPFDDFFNGDDKQGKKENWKVVREMLGNLIEPAKSWEQANCLGAINDMAVHFTEAYPDIACSVEDLRMALHDLNITYDRNEHNNKYYYLAKWK